MQRNSKYKVKCDTCVIAHPRLGITAHCPPMLAIRLLWVNMTPLGKPVEPLVYMITAKSSGIGRWVSMDSGIEAQDIRMSKPEHKTYRC